MFANSRGLRGLDKYLHFFDCVQGIVFNFLGISEIGRRDYSTSLLNRLSGGDDFTWFSRPRRGLSSFLLLGVRAYTMHLLAISVGDFHIKPHICKADNLMWSLVAMNGIAKH
jgi:hypothetical protein